MAPGGKTIKCVVWDLDDTLWRGVLLEEPVSLRPHADEVIRTLDERGILQSIASRTDADTARAELESLGLAEYFVAPQLHFGAKSGSLRSIAEQLNLGLDTFALVDDQPFEREEVRHVHPDVLLVDGSAPLRGLLALPRMNPRFVTADSRRRRLMYRQEELREAAEERFEGPSAEFMASLDLRLTIAPAQEEDLRRAEELTERTSQLNSTGQVYSHDELSRLRTSADHLLLVADLEDRFGSYGRSGLALVETFEGRWTLKLLIASCRVLSRGVGSLLLRDVMVRARASGAQLRAELRDTGRNRLMHVTYRFAGFREAGRRGDLLLLEHDLARIPELPGHVTLRSL